ncbi:major facilitator superfamily transporter [Trichoderma arundinaceum]|uniref:Major facilitator superfamily transporter n=1 Tax=Trichoderma arundinaceum TaxID=490622 RepID=A0A395P0N1_TRIAR|nr:major facilitator superfamily transporter [Trichoderma arundinaceum]
MEQLRIDREERPGSVDDSVETFECTSRHPREGLESWRWPLIVISLMLTMLIIGYDVSNIANVQTSVYEAFGHVELLPWVAVGYSTLSAATAPLWRKIAAIYPLKILFLVAEFLMALGSILAGVAPNMNTVIIGRVITGFGSAGAFMSGSIYILLLTTPTEYAQYMGLMGVSWAVGLVLGPIIGGLFADNIHTTWRWLIPFCTTRERQIFPVGLFFENRAILLIFISTFAAGGSYGISLYYTPLFFAFTQGLSPIDAAVRLLPYICSFILSTVLSAGILPRARVYPPFYILSGALMMAGAGGLSTIEPTTPSGKILGLDTLSGISVGLIWQTGNAVMSRLVRDIPDLDRNDAAEVAENEARKVSLRQDTAMLHLVSQLFGVSVALSCAGCVFQNFGYSKLRQYISGLGNFSSQDIRDALAGVDSNIFHSGQDPRVFRLAIQAITTTIARLQWIAFAGGAVTFIAGLCMKWEKLDFEPESAGKGEKTTGYSPVNAV